MGLHTQSAQSIRRTVMARRPVLAAALLLLQLGLSTQQGCSLGNENVRGRGAQGNGGNDDTWAFQQVESDGGAGLIYVPDGTYLITQRLTLTKPIVGTAGAVLKVRPPPAPALSAPAAEAPCPALSGCKPCQVACKRRRRWPTAWCWSCKPSPPTR